MDTRGSRSEIGEVHDLIEQFVGLLDRGEAPSIDEFASRYPQHAELLRQLLPASVLLGNLSDASSDIQSKRLTADQTPNVLGDFRLIRELGRGGMGIVYEAQQISLDRLVALKILPFASLLDERQLKRFRGEARAAGMLQHPNIVSVYSVGAEKSIHFYAMELISGCSLADVIASRGRPIEQTSEPGTATPHAATSDSVCDATTPIAHLSTQHATDRRSFYRSVAKLGIQAAEALHYAHQEGIVHRDIKPANLLLDARGNLHITDFGLARTQNHDDLTLSGELVGTLRYMSPEQVDGHGIIDVHSDIYSLGATLYELITDRPVFNDSQRQTLMRHIVEREAIPLSHVVRDIPRDLENIVLKSISKAPVDRYVSAQELAEDLHRFLQNRPVRARRMNSIQRSLRWCGRNRAKAALLGMTAALLLTFAVGGTIAAVYQAQVATAQAQVAAQRRRELYAAHIKEAYEAYREGEHNYVDQLLERYRPQGLESDLRGFEWHFLRTHTRRQVEAPFVRAGMSVHSIAHSPDASRVVLGNWRGRLTCLDARTMGELWSLAPRDGPNRPHHDDIVYDVRFSSDGEILATVSRDQSIKIWNAETGELLASEVLPGPGKSVAVSNDNLIAVRLMAVRSLHRTRPSAEATSAIIFRLIRDSDEVASLEVLRTLRGFSGVVESVDFSPDGRVLAAGSHDALVRRWDTSTFEELPALEHHAGPIKSLSYAPNGSYLAVGGGIHRKRWLAGELVVWKLPEGIPAWRSHAHDGSVEDVCFSLDGFLVASASMDKTVRVFESSTGRWVDTVSAHASPIFTACFGATKHQLFTGGNDNVVRRWTIGDALRDQLTGHAGDVSGIGFSRDSQILITTSNDRTVRRWSVKDGSSLGQVCQVSELPDALACSPTEDLLAVGGGPFPLSTGAPALLEVWNYNVNRRLHQLTGHFEKVIDVAFSPDGKQLASGGSLGEVLLWDVASGALLHRFEPGDVKNAYVAKIAFSPDGRWIVVGHISAVKIWNANTFQIEGQIEADGANHYGIAVSPRGRQLAIGGIDGPIRLVQLPDGNSPRVLRGHGDTVISLNFSPDGRRLVSGGKDMSVKLWDVDSGLELMTLRDASGWVWRVKFAPDGNSLAIGSSPTVHESSLVLMRASHD